MRILHIPGLRIKESKSLKSFHNFRELSVLDPEPKDIHTRTIVIHTNFRKFVYHRFTRPSGPIKYSKTGKFRDIKIQQIWTLGNFVTGKVRKIWDRGGS